MKKNLLSVIVFLLIASNCSPQALRSDKILTTLKSELEKEHFYDLSKEKRIKQLRNELDHTDINNFNDRYALCGRIFEEYHSFKFDSAFIYVRKMIALSEKFNQPENLIKSKILLGSTLLNSGFYKEAFDIVATINVNGLSDSLKTDYLNLRARLNSGIGDYDNDAYFSKIYRQRSDEDFKSAEITTPSNDFEKTINLAFQPDSIRDKKLTPDFYYNFITSRGLPEHKVAMVATRLSFAYTRDDRILFLALAAINDIRSSTKETLAIFLLGQELFQLNRTDDAYIMMQHAVKNARFYGARSREVQIESILPLVAGKVIDQKQHERDKLLIGFLIFLIVAVILFFVLVIYRKQLQRIKSNERVIKEINCELKSINGKLWESSRIKEEFIGLFFKTCSSYIETLDKVKRRAQHNIKLGKYNDANTVLEKVQIDKEKDQLYDTLDTMFLTLFPNFVTSFNALLKTEDQIWPKNGEMLNATLRIFALVRLGVSELETIAKILDYSVSTVYTYKNRVKVKALVPAEDFERKIMEIKFIDDLKPLSTSS
jgi:hypothetical protein